MFNRTVTRSERQPFTRQVTAIGPHWVLDQRHQNIEKNHTDRTSRHQETTHEEITYLLLPDGSLKYVAVWEEETVHISDATPRVVIDRSHHLRDIGDGELKGPSTSRRCTASTGDTVRGSRPGATANPGRSSWCTRKVSDCPWP